jgi:hypothetical protein
MNRFGGNRCSTCLSAGEQCRSAAVFIPYLEEERDLETASRVSKPYGSKHARVCDKVLAKVVNE